MKIYILLTDTSTVFSRVIKLYTKKKYTHACISFNKELTQVYSFGIKKSMNPFRGGFVQEHLENKVYRNADCTVYSCEVTEEEYAKMLARVQEMEAQKARYRYNLLGLLGVVFQKEIKRKNAFFCSQFVAAILQEGGISISDKPLGLVQPYDIQQSQKLKLEYQGCVKDYESFLKPAYQYELKMKINPSFNRFNERFVQL